MHDFILLRDIVIILAAVILVIPILYSLASSSSRTGRHSSPMSQT
jgi:hypothetical protein